MQLRDATPAEGLVQLDADTSMSPGNFRSGLARRRRRRARGRRGVGKKGRQRLCRHAAARPSCRDRAADGLLPVRQCRDRGASRAEASRHRPRGDRRFRRASRQRLAGDFLGGQDGDVLLDPPDAAVIPAPARSAKPANTIRSSTRRCGPATAARRSAPRSRTAFCRGLRTFGRS